MIHDSITQPNQLVLFIRKKKLKNYKKNSQTQSLNTGRGYRKVVASPLPQSILEHQLIRTLADGKNIVHCMRWWRYSSYKKRNTYEGVEAVIDKDFASQISNAD